MAFGPGVETIVLELISGTDYSKDQLDEAENAKVSTRDIARAELKLWIDYGEAIGQLVIHVGCIEEGRSRYFSNIVKFLKSNPSDIETALTGSQICTTRAATNAAQICKDERCTEISVEHYKKGCDTAYTNINAIMERLAKNQKDITIMVPLCDDPLLGD